MGTISVVIPALNDARFLEVCLAAVADQTRQADEVIVVDNGSTDDTAAVARAHGATVLSQPLRGIFSAAATGYDAAGCDIIARLDADSIPPIDWLERVETALSTAPPLSAVTGMGDYYDSGTITAWLGRFVYLGGYFWSMGWLLGHPPVYGSNFAMHRAFWERTRTGVHRDIRKVHDDLDLSIHVEPDMTVLYDHALRVGVSARPFQSVGGIARRTWWAYLTLSTNWREGSLLRRRRVRRRARRRGSRG